MSVEQNSFITNRDRFLSEVINGILPKCSSVDVLVGYFYYSVFDLIYENINVILAPKYDQLFLPMSEPLIQVIADYGYFKFWFLGHCFFLGTIPTRAQLTKDIYLQKKVNDCILYAEGNEYLTEFTDIRQIDFFMNRFRNKNIEYNPKKLITQQKYEQ